MKSTSAASVPGPGPAFLSEAPRPSLPMAFFLPGVALLLAAAFAAPFLSVKMADWTYQQEILALVHTVTLGFLLAVFLGASVQLLPVVAGVTVTRTLLVRGAAVCYFAGSLGMVFHFAVLRWNGLVLSAIAVTLAVVLFFFAVLPVLVKAPRGPVRLAFTLSYAGLALTMTAGLLIGCDRRHAFLPGAPLDHLAALAVALFRGRAGELRAATVFFAISLLPFAAHVALVVSHLKKPRAFAAPAGTWYASAH